ncbi:MAG: Mbeg1-like protein [Candidatus Enteromonas sp.]
MNINTYLRRFGQCTLREMAFNEIDALILSELSYVNFQLVAPSIDEPKVKPLRLKKLVVEDPLAFYRGSVDAISNMTMVKLMMKSRRFKDIKIGFCQNIFEERTVNQFFAMTIFLPTGEAFVAFRGTDTSILGWKEDFYFAFEEAILAQVEALEYVNRMAPYLPERFYLGGHSKGGNLSMYAALHMSEELQDRLIRAYSFDGPGFRKSVTGLPRFEAVLPKLSKYITKNDIIGMLFNVMPATKIVVSTGLMFGGHDPFYWQLEKGRPAFRTVEDTSKSSKRNAKVMMEWLASMSDEDKMLLIQFLFRVFEQRENVYELIVFGIADLVQIPKILRSYSTEERKKIKAMLLALKDFYLDSFRRGKRIMQAKEEATDK